VIILQLVREDKVWVLTTVPALLGTVPVALIGLFSAGLAFRSIEDVRKHSIKPY
jgi:hypothetical protein